MISVNVALTLFAKMRSANVYQIILEIHTHHADRNVLLIPNVHVRRLALINAVEILALELAVTMLFATSSITFRCVVVQLIWLAIHSNSARFLENVSVPFFSSFQTDQYFWFSLKKKKISSFAVPPTQPCSPSPCGPNSVCKVIENHAVCSCQPTFVGSPPACRPECVVSTECPLDQACLNNKCRDPCPGSCGQNAKCQSINHNPICSCYERYTGDPFSACYPMPGKLTFFFFFREILFLFLFLYCSMNKYFSSILYLFHCRQTVRILKYVSTF